MDSNKDGGANPAEPSPKNPYKDPDDGRQRFLLELEFVHCLANPTYIQYLAQNRYFEDKAFIGYLKYLQYWQRPEYVKFIMNWLIGNSFIYGRTTESRLKVETHITSVSSRTYSPTTCTDGCFCCSTICIFTHADDCCIWTKSDEGRHEIYWRRQKKK